MMPLVGAGEIFVIAAIVLAIFLLAFLFRLFRSWQERG